MPYATEQNITDLAVQRWSSAREDRLASIMTSLVRHLHDFARDVRLSEDEWIEAMKWLAATGQISDEKREEFILASDVLGLSMLVVQMNNRFSEGATPATVLGPFHIDGSPVASYGWDMSEGVEGIPFFISGTVRSVDGTPIAGAVLDVWQADGEGMYESQLGFDEARLRAKYSTRDDGTYLLRSIVPLGYAIPMDGPVGDLISRTDISPFRPAHIHFLLEEDGYERLVTHLFAQGTPYLDDDVVFGTKAELITAFESHSSGTAPDGTQIDGPFVTATYDFVLQPALGAADAG